MPAKINETQYSIELQHYVNFTQKRYLKEKYYMYASQPIFAVC